MQPKTIEIAENQPASAIKSSAPERKFFLALLIYFSIQVFLRLITSNSTDLDESQQLVLTQQFQWGYGPQPPLYTWILIVVFKILAPSIFSLTLLKNLLLFGTYALTYLNARRITGNHALGMAAALSLLFIPQIAWESQRDLTHTVLATALVTATFHFFLRLREKPSAANYFLFGLSCGLGLLSKYNYAAFLFGLIAGALSLLSFRKIIRNPKIFLALAVCALVVLPHAIWAFQNPHDVTSAAHKFKIQSGAPWLKILFTGLKNLLLASSAHVGVLVAIVGLLALTSRSAGRTEISGREPAKLILREIFVVLAALACGVVAFKVTAFRERWFQPVFVCLPVALIAFWQHRLGKKQLRVIFALVCVAMLGVSIVTPARILFAEKLHRTEELNAPFDKFSADIRASFPQANCFVAEDFWVGGNLRLHFPEAIVLTPQLPKTWRSQPVENNCLVVWNATSKMRSKSFDGLNQIAQFDDATTHFQDESLKFHHEKQMRLGIVPGKIKPPTESR